MDDPEFDTEVAELEIEARGGFNKWFAFVKDTPLVLILTGFFTVILCCVVSQFIVACSKTSNL